MVECLSYDSMDDGSPFLLLWENLERYSCEVFDLVQPYNLYFSFGPFPILFPLDCELLKVESSHDPYRPWLVLYRNTENTRLYIRHFLAIWLLIQTFSNCSCRRIGILDTHILSPFQCIVVSSAIREHNTIRTCH